MQERMIINSITKFAGVTKIPLYGVTNLIEKNLRNRAETLAKGTSVI